MRACNANAVAATAPEQRAAPEPPKNGHITLYQSVDWCVEQVLTVFFLLGGCCGRFIRKLAMQSRMVAIILVLSAPAAARESVLEEHDLNQIRGHILGDGGASVIAIGESAHDDPATQATRNDLVLDLVRRNLVGLVILESGYAESRVLNAYVRGLRADPSAKQTGLTNGFGLFAHNIALIEALRTENLARPSEERIGLLGMDLSAGGPWGAAPGIAPVDCALEAIDPEVRDGLRAKFDRLVSPGLMGEAVPSSLILAYRQAVQELNALTPATAPTDQRLCARIVAQGVSLLEALPPGLPDGKFPGSVWKTIETRDRGMAEIVQQLIPLAKKKPVVIVSHLTHAAAAPMVGPRWASLDQSPTSTGTILRQQLGRTYRAVLVIGEKQDSPCFEQLQTIVVDKLADQECNVRINGGDIQQINLNRAADVAIFPGRAK